MIKIGRKSAVFIFTVLISCFLYGAFSVHRILKISRSEFNQSENHKFSVILGTTYLDEENIEEFFQGAKEEAEKFDCVVNLLRPLSVADSKGLKDWLKYASYSCADGIILFSDRDDFVIGEVFDVHGRQIPVVAAGNTSRNSNVVSRVTSNRYEMGKKLASLINENPDWKKMTLLESKNVNFSGKNVVIEAIKSNVSTSVSFSTNIIYSTNIEDDIKRMLLNSVREKKADAIICFSAEDLNTVGQAVVDLNLTGKIDIIGILGNKTSRRYVEKGIVKGIVTINPHEMGADSIEELFAWKENGFSNSLKMVNLETIKGGER